MRWARQSKSAAAYSQRQILRSAKPVDTPGNKKKPPHLYFLREVSSPEPARRILYVAKQSLDMIKNKRPAPPPPPPRQSRYGSTEINKALRKDFGGTPKGARAAHMSISLG